MTEQFTVLALAPGGDNTLARQCLEAVKHEFGLTSTLLVAQFRREGARVLTALTMEEAVAAGERARGLGAGYRVLDGQRVVVAEEDGTGVPEPVDNHGHDHVSGEDELAREDEVEGDQQELDLEQHDSPELARAHIGRLYDDLPRLGHYELLGLTQEASHEQIQKAFYDMALFMHPDRHFASEDVDLKDKLHAIYKRVTACYQVLMNPETRREYDVQLKLAERDEYEAARAAGRQAAAAVVEVPPEERLVLLDESTTGQPGLAEPQKKEPRQQEPREEPRSAAPVRVTRSSGIHDAVRSPVDVVLEDTAPPPDREEELPTPADVRRRYGSDEHLPAASEPVPEEELQAMLAESRPARPTPRPRKPAPTRSAEERYGNARAEKAPAKRRPLARILMGLVVAVVVGAVVPALYTGYAYFSQMEPLLQELSVAEAAVAIAGDPAAARARVEQVDRRLFKAVWAHVLFTCVFWGILSILVGVMWFRRH